MRTGIPGGSAACREVAAYLLDHDGFAGVPPTTLAMMQHEAFFSSDATRAAADKKLKIGSLQAFVAHSYDAEDLPSSTIRRFPVAEVHKLAVLDIRLCNTDRHGGNILVRDPAHDKLVVAQQRQHASSTTPSVSSSGDESSEASGSFDSLARQRNNSIDLPAPVRPFSLSMSVGDEGALRLVPIDHGYVLPEDLSEAWFAWMTFPQANEPFDDATRRYIAQLDWRADCAVLRRFGMTFTPACQRVLRTTTMLLQRGAAANLTPRAIAMLLCREQLDEPSRLEQMCATARADVEPSAASSSPSSSSSSSRSRAQTLNSLPAPSAGFFARATITHDRRAARRSATLPAQNDEPYFARLGELLDEAIELLAHGDDASSPSLSHSAGLFDFELDT